jgi:hypothetical protein
MVGLRQKHQARKVGLRDRSDHRQTIQSNTRIVPTTLCLYKHTPLQAYLLNDIPLSEPARKTNMSAQIYPPYPPTLTTPEKEYLLSNLKDWSIAHGLAVRPIESFVSKETDPAGALATTAPVTLFPSLFPRTCFEQAKAVSKAYNELYSAISVDEAWLGEICNE